MAHSNPDPTPPAAGLQAMLARLRGMVQAQHAAEQPAEDLLPSWDTEPPIAAPAPPVEPLPVAFPVFAEVPIPVAQPVVPDALLPEPVSLPVALPAEVAPTPPVLAELPPEEPSDTSPTRPALCPFCQAPRKAGQSYCDDCGLIFPAEEPAAPAVLPVAVGNSSRLVERYELGERICERAGVERFRGLDYGSAAPVPVILIRAAVAPTANVTELSSEIPAVEEEVLPTFDTPAVPPVAVTLEPTWPGVAWEATLLEKAAHPVLPRVLDRFSDGGWDYLVEDAPTGQTLWDAWDDPDATAEQRFGWLRQVAEALDALHQAGALIEGLRPDAVVLTAEGQVRFTDLSHLLPLPLPPGTPVRATPYSAPELLLGSDQVDARADLYHFGALLFSLHVGRELTEIDFVRQGTPKDFLPLFPEVHPLLGRLMMKTFCRELAQRFPTDEAGREDPTGFAELLRTLDVCRRTLDRVRLEIAAWTTTGMVRTGNEDAFALLHAIEARQDDLSESALVLLADGMGGYESGEVAAALAIQVLRKNLLEQHPFAALAGASPPESAAPPDVDEYRRLVEAALKDANKQVYTAARTGVGKRGMGCTAEVVFVDGRNLIVGHVGDSRTYHLRQGQLVQLTRDQTLVNRLVELSQLSAEEAATHPRRSELQQAIGGHPDVEPEVLDSVLMPGDWVVVCSDGLSNHVLTGTLKEMLQTAGSAEVAARRLVNLVNLEGATDNATIVVLRVT